MKFLGLRLCDHDSNITYTDGNTVRYIKSERLRQIKHHGYNNFSAWISDIQHWNIDYSSLDGCAICVDKGNVDFKIDDSVLFQKVNSFIPNINCPTYVVDHHFAHALSCWPIIDTEKVTTDFVFDGFGDFNRSHSIFKGSQLAISSTKPSIGSLLTRWGESIGVEGHPLDISGKVMAMKSFGSINYQFLNDNNDLSINEIHKAFDMLKWLPYKTENNKDWLASLHKLIEDKITEYFLKNAQSEEIITFSGGVAQNICINSQLKKQFNNLYIPPHNPDDGLSLGCVEFLRQLNDQPKFDNTGFPFWQDEEVPEFPTEETIDKIAQLLADGKIVGWFQGKGEIGPRALGNRSILMRPDIRDGKDIINNKVKHRENYRPFGCSVLEEYANTYFECDYPSPYMLYSVPVKNPELLPAITHVDGTSRIQTVDQTHKIFHSLLEKFHNKTGLPILLNTSLNINKKPIASTSKDAMGVYETTGLDVLCIGNTIYIK
jgi:carbamoyltransferase